jgi:DNA-binding FadR family transcriptional regulator
MADAALFTPRHRHRLVRDVADHLRRRIVSGDLPVGHPLPAMRRLARLYGVSLPTLHAALHTLESVGFVRITHGVGTFVTQPRSASRQLVYAWQEATPFELATMRAAIDERMPVVAAHVVRAAAGRALPMAVRDLQFFANERSMNRIGVAAESFIAADLTFHTAVLATARGIEVSASLYGQIAGRLKPHLLSAAARQALDPGLDAAHVALAGAIVDANVLAVARLARGIARREARTVHDVLRAG